MSFQSVILNQLKQSGTTLNSIGDLASYLLEDVRIRIERTGIEPVHETEFALLSASTMVKQATSTEITDSEIFLNSVSEGLNDMIYAVLGRSPGLIEDIADAIVKPVKDIIDTALKPIQDTVGGIIKTVQSKIDDGVKFIQNGFDNATKTVTSWVDSGFKLIGEGVNFIKATINNLLEGVINIFDWFILVFQQSFAFLADTFTSLLSFEIEDVFKVTESMSKQFEEKQTETLKKRAGM